MLFLPDSIPPRTPLQLRFSSSSIAPDQRFTIQAPVPLEWVDTAAVHLRVMVDSVLQDTLCTFRKIPGTVRHYELLTQWSPGRDYTLEIDSAAFRSIYGLTSNYIKQTIKVNFR